MISFQASQLETGWFSNRIEACTLNLMKTTGDIRIYNGIDTKISKRKFNISHIDQVITCNADCMTEGSKIKRMINPTYNATIVFKDK